MFKIQHSSRSAGAPIYFDDFQTRDAWQNALRAPLQFSALPATNVVETSDAFVIELVAPGLTHEQLDISVGTHSIEVRFDPDSTDFETLHRRRIWRSEYMPMPFQRTFELNGDLLDLDALSISSTLGLIHIHIPKQEAVRGRIVPFVPFSSN